MSVDPADLFSWACGIAAKGDNVDETAMRAAISRAYYGVYFEVRDVLIAAGIKAAWGRHEVVIDFMKQRA